MDLEALVGERMAGTPDRSPVRQLVDVAEFPLDHLGQGERIQTGTQPLQRRQVGAIDAVGGAEPIQRVWGTP